MHYVVAPQPGLECEHRQNRQRGKAQSGITQRRPRQRPQDDEGSERNVETIHSSLWCTGKDSNLRTSEEGQIYSLLALTTHPPVQNCRTVRPSCLSGIPCRHLRHGRWFRRTLRKVKNRKARANMPSHANTTLGKFLM